MWSYLNNAIREGLVLETAISTPRDADENIMRGEIAMRHVISSHKMEPRAMFRKEIGWIGFEWGKPGETPPEFKDHAEFRKWQKSGRRPFEGGYGISHIIAKRDWEGRFIEEFSGQSGIAVAMRIVSAIARGQANTRGNSASIEWGDMDVYFRKKTDGANIYWLLSGYTVPTHGYKYKPENAR